MDQIYEKYDIAVIGAGHAGCEAALAAARLGLETICFVVSTDSIALMPCNPNVGGTSKGHLVREIDALGGEMGKNIDKTYIQSKMLNVSKGPAVHSLRAQADKQEYSREMRKVLENQEHLTVRQGEVSEILVEEGHVTGVRILSGGIYPCDAAIICTGTYLNARCIYGDFERFTGPNGLPAANHLTDCLKKLGLEIVRFKTGTPARIDKRSIDFSKMEPQTGDERIVPFSFENTEEGIKKEQVNCWLTHTTLETHDIIRANIDRSPLYSGNIKGTGPRYCPSIEDKVMKFPDKESHQVFIEPEGNYTNEMYISGMSSSLPEDVQYAMYRSVPGLEHARIVRNAYAIEYDCLNPIELTASLELKKIHGLFSAGQMNGSSGYEEAAAQGLIAGINAARLLKKQPPLILDRSQAYIGVLIDDLCTKETHEPYRMMTSRAEYRLLLRQDNADLRLSEIGHEIGLLSDLRYEKFLLKKNQIETEIKRLKETVFGGKEYIQNFLVSHNSSPLRTAASLSDLISRPEFDYDSISEIDTNRPKLPCEVTEQVEIEIKYEGYIERERKQVEDFRKAEKKMIPSDLNYDDVPSLRKEARQKLKSFRPENIGKASRISGISPADISVLLVYMKSKYGNSHTVD